MIAKNEGRHAHEENHIVVAPDVEEIGGRGASRGLLAELVGAHSGVATRGRTNSRGRERGGRGDGGGKGDRLQHARCCDETRQRSPVQALLS